jgi:serine/threonine protein phosphatase PrpC
MSSGPFSKLRNKGGGKKKEGEGLVKTRRRLSVVSDNKLVEGLSGLHTGEEETSGAAGGGKHWVTGYAGVSKKGYAPYNPRKKNQDILIMQEDEATGTLLLAVFDGHGEAGDGVSQFFRAQLPPTLFAHPEFPNTPTYEGKRAPKTGEQSLIGTAVNGDDAGSEGWEKALVESVQFLEKNLLRDSSIDTEFSGTTAVINLIRGDLCLTANIGDSRITLGRSDGGGCKAIPLSDDHKPDRPDEKERIIKRGGRVFAVEYDDGIDGPFRVWLGHMDVPGLAMARSLGDTVAHSAGVISDPEFSIYKFDENDKYLVVASDGLWEFMTDQEVIDIVATQTENRRTVDLLIMEANGRWMKEEQVIDDTTVIVATVGPPS